jgi:hypothetical protein
VEKLAKPKPEDLNSFVLLLFDFATQDLPQLMNPNYLPILMLLVTLMLHLT